MSRRIKKSHYEEIPILAFVVTMKTRAYRDLLLGIIYVTSVVLC